MIKIDPPSPSITLGVVADTHVPDRVDVLHPGLIPELRRASVDHILHAGDICMPGVLADLEQIAPVTAVRGNRDWALATRLPFEQKIDIFGYLVLLTHGHGSWLNYLRGKAYFMFEGYRFERFRKTLIQPQPGTTVIVFGHTHRPENVWREGTLLFNPGSASSRQHPDIPPSFGVVKLTKDGDVFAEIVALEGMRINSRRWVR